MSLFGYISKALGLFFLGLLFPLSLVAQPYIFISDFSGAIFRADIDDPAGTVVTFLPPQTQAGALAFDFINKRLFYVEVNDQGADRILAVDIEDPVVPEVILEDLNDINQLAFDSDNQTLFLIVNNISSTSLLSLDIGNPQAEPIVIVEAFSSDAPGTVSFDSANERVYWVTSDTFIVRASDYDGSNSSTVFSFSPNFVSNIVVDSSKQKLYWSDSSASQLGRNDLSGANQEIIATGFGGGALDVDFLSDPINVYYIDAQSDTVQKVILDDTPELLLDSSNGITSPRYIVFAAVVVDPTPTPTPSPTPTPAIPLTPSTELTEPPAAEPVGRSVSIFLQPIDEVLLEDLASTFFAVFDFESLPARRNRVTFRYNLRVTGPRKRDNVNRLVKRNEVTLKRLRPGEYSVKYRAIAYERRNKKAKQKLLARGKSKFQSNFRPAFSTNFSPSSGFSISK